MKIKPRFNIIITKNDLEQIILEKIQKEFEIGKKELETKLLDLDDGAIICDLKVKIDDAESSDIDYTIFIKIALKKIHELLTEYAIQKLEKAENVSYKNLGLTWEKQFESIGWDDKKVCSFQLEKITEDPDDFQ